MSGDRPVVLIVGAGRSGTNWLMRLLDASTTTFCRSEPLDIPSSPIHALPDRQAMAAGADAAMARAWDEFLEWTVTHSGVRDLRPGAPKEYYRTWAQRLHLIDFWTRRPARLARRYLPRYRREEWPVAFVHAERFATSTAVIKVNGLPEWHCKWILEHRPEVRVIHIVRHPGGALHSAENRFFSRLGPDELAAEQALYAGHIEHAAAEYPDWAALDVEPSGLSPVEALAWSWRYQNEMIEAAGRGRPNYSLVVYEHLAADPLATARRLYHFCDLALDAATMDRIEATLGSNNWRDLAGSPERVANRWKTEARPELQALAETVLADSDLAAHWN